MIGAATMGATGVLVRAIGGALMRAIGGLMRATGGVLTRAGGVLARATGVPTRAVGTLGGVLARAAGAGALGRAGGVGGRLGRAIVVMLPASGALGRGRGGGSELARGRAGDAWGLSTPCANFVFSPGSSVTAWGRATWDRGLGGLGGTGPIRPIGVPFTFTDEVVLFTTGRETGGFARFGSVSSARALRIVASASS